MRPEDIEFDEKWRDENLIDWKQRALRAEAQLKIAMEALNTIGFSPLDCMNRCCRSEAKKAIAKINALKEGKET